jgi:hypothetical protein
MILHYQFFFPPGFPAFFSFNADTTTVKQPIGPVSEILNDPEVKKKEVLIFNLTISNNLL